jgi:hypothetical protein
MWSRQRVEESTVFMFALFNLCDVGIDLRLLCNDELALLDVGALTLNRI